MSRCIGTSGKVGFSGLTRPKCQQSGSEERLLHARSPLPMPRPHCCRNPPDRERVCASWASWQFSALLNPEQERREEGDRRGEQRTDGRVSIGASPERETGRQTGRRQRPLWNGAILTRWSTVSKGKPGREGGRQPARLALYEEQ